MNKEAIFHMPDSKFCFAADEKTVVLRLRTSKSDKFDYVGVIYGSKYEFHEKQHEQELKKQYTDNYFDYYITQISLDDVRFVYIFKIVENGIVNYYCEEGISQEYDFSLAYMNAFQLPYINFADIHHVVPWMRKAVFYEIFIDRFYRGDLNKKDDYINLKWGEIPNPKSFAGGDLKGITQKLDYLKDLGINALYLTPIFCSISNHKYDIYDYFNVDPQFGGNEAFKDLVNQAHRAGIRIVLDGVFNHCSELLPQFQDVLKNGKNSPYFDWFIIRGEKPDPKNLNYECFSSCSYMPKFNTSNPDVQKFLLDIAVYWIKEYDIDGWRLDVSDEVSHDFWRVFRKTVKQVKEDCVIIGENWHDAYPYLHGDQYDSIMNYAFTKANMDFFVKGSISSQEFAERLSRILMCNTDQVNFMMLNLLDSHDTLRFLTQLNEKTDKLICALAVMFMFVGVPCIYYGTEIGMVGGYDPDCRRTFDWQKADKETPLFSITKALINLKSRSELVYGQIRLSSYNDLFILERFYQNKKLRLTLNNGLDNKSYSSEGTVLVSHNLISEKLNSFGFVIEEVE
ncbi:MAG TPA: glycoside hydrolase family 13 protein [Clostridia bacterium]